MMTTAASPKPATNNSLSPALLDRMANAIRALAMDAVEKANSGHPGMPMGMADVATVLYTQFLKYNPQQPNWPDRDRFILSAGHGSMLLYALLHLTGYEDVTLEQIKNFRQLHSKTNGHPEYGEAGGIETTTGPLGQGLGNAVGMALAEAMLESRYGKELVDHYTYVIAGDGCLMEGISQEAISFAGHLKLRKLILLWDDNRISIDGPISLSSSEDMQKRFDACGWNVQTIDGHDKQAIAKAIANAQKSDKPSMIACRTTIGKGAPNKAGSHDSHGSPLGAKEIEGARKNLGWEHGDFEVPSDVADAWRNAGTQATEEYAAWEKRLKVSPKHKEFLAAQEGKLPAEAASGFAKIKAEFAKAAPMATRKSSSMVLDALTPVIPTLLGGSADLTGSNLTKAKTQTGVTPDDYSGNYLYYGIREHGMAAAMNGIALHKGFIPYGGTFFVFTDYCRPSIRLAALMKQRVIYVMTHDSIGLGEDGPTHQPVEHLASLRAMPNLLLLRPADAVEVAESWELALNNTTGPTMLVLSRQNLPTVRTEEGTENKAAKGAYILKDAANPKAVLLATGSEVAIAMDAAKQLEEAGIATRVVSVPSFGLFDKQGKEYRKKLLGENTVKVAVEAAVQFGWERYLGEDGIFIGMPGFGASAPAPELYKHFGITAENIVKQVKNTLK